MVNRKIKSYLPVTDWGKRYSRELFTLDLTAAIIVTLMLVPQALAYSILSGLPAYIGLYASILPLIVYALLGTSSTLAVGPVAVAALMTATAVAPFSAISVETGIAAAIVLACISGIVLVLAGMFKLGFIANFLSHPVIAGFINAASVIIAFSQLPIIFGFSVRGDTLPELVHGISEKLDQTHVPTLILGALTILLLFLSRKYGQGIFLKCGLNTFWASTFNRAVPALLVVLGIILIQSDISWIRSIHTIGHIPEGLPPFALPEFDYSLWQQLWLPAVLISIVGYVESISVAQSMAAKRRERIDPDQELIALGVANLSSSVSSGLPVTGGVSRSVVNADAGAATPAAGLYTAIGMIIACLFITQWLSDLPKFVLAATIIVAVVSLFDFRIFIKTWQLNRKEFFAMLITFLLTLLINVEWGISVGVLISIGLHLYRSSKPHTAVVGHVEGTEHFRNILRHDVKLCPEITTLRVDESLYFANARYLEQRILDLISNNPSVKHFILMCPAVNDIDSSALEVLESINHELKTAGIGFHLSEVKGPVMDYLNKTEFPSLLNGKIYLTQYQAYVELAELDKQNTKSVPEPASNYVI